MVQQNLILPPKSGNGQHEVLECHEPLVIIGANGSGKSRLGAWIEQNQEKPEKVHRVSAQRALDFSEYVNLKSLEQAENELFFGIADFQLQRYGSAVFAKNNYRWQLGNRPPLSVTPLLNDFDSVLSVLFARKAQRDSQLAKRVRELQIEGKNELPKMQDSPDEVLICLWNDILPHRKLIIEDGKITVSIPGGGNTYQGREMSDGERVALYLMAQCLCVVPDSIVIIDEPEIHLHKSLMAKLWSKIEEAQPHCLFIYITHDIEFAASRIGSRKIWIKSYDGNHWIWDEVPETEGLPESVLLEIVGSRKRILFVEGEKGSLDYKLYQAMYPDFLIMPRGGCEKVIQSTKAMRNNSSLHHVDAFGLIDMDYKVQEEVDCLKMSGIFPLNVAEIENILCVQEVLNIVSKCLAKNPQDTYTKLVDFVIQKLVEEQEIQVSRRSAFEIEFKLNTFNVKARGETELKASLTSLVSSIDIENIYNKNLAIYQDIIVNKDYRKALLFYNNKGLSKMISSPLGLKPGEYREFVLRLLTTEYKDAIVAGLKKYAPYPVECLN
jgi:ABC-type lipoprotein export system ATPase subunit